MAREVPRVDDAVSSPDSQGLPPGYLTQWVIEHPAEQLRFPAVSVASASARRGLELMVTVAVVVRIEGYSRSHEFIDAVEDVG
jgi:hypothetical protein